MLRAIIAAKVFQKSTMSLAFCQMISIPKTRVTGCFDDQRPLPVIAMATGGETPAYSRTPTWGYLTFDMTLSSPVAFINQPQISDDIQVHRAALAAEPTVMPRRRDHGGIVGAEIKGGHRNRDG